MRPTSWTASAAAFALWTMSDQQHAVLLDMLLSRDDVAVLQGMTKDRASREVIGIAADSVALPGVLS